MRATLSFFTLLALSCGNAIADDKADALFSQLDKNKDGFITKDEVQADQVNLFDRLIRNADKNSDGKLDKAEFTAGLQSQRPDRPLDKPGAPERRGPAGEGGGPEAFFKKLDANGDGKIVADEVPAEFKDRFAKMLESLDANKDNAIDLNEFKKGAERLAGGLKRPEGGGPDAEALFKRLDKNGDGKVEESEVPEEFRAKFGDILARANLKDQKSITLDQFRAVVGQLARRAEGKPEGRPERKPEGRPEGRPGIGAEAIARFNPLFRALDTNGDGKLSSGEIEAAATVLKKLDKNGDGEITPDEVAPQFPGRRPEGAPGDGAGRGGEFLQRFIKEHDKNNDGKLSKEESPERLKGRFDEVDTNKDGQLDEAELKAMFGRFPGRGGPDGGPRKRPERKPENN